MGFDKIPGIIQNAWQQIQDNQKAASALANITQYTEKTNFADVMTGNPKVLAEHILHKTPVTASITIPVRNYIDNGATGYTATIPFYMTGDFTFTLGNEWSEVYDLSSLENLSQFINIGHAALGHGEAQISMQSEAMSSKVWKKSTFGGFHVDCLFVCTNRKFSTLKILNTLTAACLPTKFNEQENAGGAGLKNAHVVAETLVDLGGEFVGGVVDAFGSISGGKFDTSGAQNMVSGMASGAKSYIKGMGMVAPLNYGLKKGDDGGAAIEEPLPNTTVTLQIGDYFRANNLVVKSLSGVTLSKEIVAPPTNNDTRKGDLYDNSTQGSDWGFPLYLKCSMDLEPHSLMHFSKWQGYFKQDNNLLNQVRQHDYPNIGGNRFDLPN